MSDEKNHPLILVGCILAMLGWAAVAGVTLF